MVRCAVQRLMTRAVVFSHKKTRILWPLLIGAFTLQLFAPFIFKDRFYLQLLCNDLADLFSACAIFFAIPYSSIKLKLFALSYAMWSNFAFLNNIAVEVAIESIRQWQFIWAAVCLCFYAFIGGFAVEIHKREKDY